VWLHSNASPAALRRELARRQPCARCCSAVQQAGCQCAFQSTSCASRHRHDCTRVFRFRSHVTRRDASSCGAERQPCWLRRTSATQAPCMQGSHCNASLPHMETSEHENLRALHEERIVERQSGGAAGTRGAWGVLPLHTRCCWGGVPLRLPRSLRTSLPRPDQPRHTLRSWCLDVAPTAPFGPPCEHTWPHPYKC
jgi:hypothetical protein